MVNTLACFAAFMLAGGDPYADRPRHPLAPSLPVLTKDENAKLEAVVDHIDRVCQIAGNARHAAIGSDLDGGFGKEQSPLDLDTIVDLQRLPDLLHNRGYDSQAIEGIMYGNWVRFFKEAWAKR